MSRNRTQWFPDTEYPARPGAYERRVGDHGPVLYSVWTGERWLALKQTPQGASGLDSAFQLRENKTFWRGMINPFLPS